MQYKDYYQVLNVKRDAAQEEIQRSYRKLARRYHPDVSKEPGAEEKFKEATEAYEVLRDPEKRARYDALGANWHTGQDFRPPPNFEELFGFSFGRGGAREHGDMQGFSSFFEALFGEPGIQGFGGDPRMTQKGRDVSAEITIALEEAYHGATKQVTLSDGAERPRTFRVKIEPGTTDGSVVRLSGQGMPGGARNGDLLLHVRIAQHPRFKVAGSDLGTVLPITPWEAALGAKIELPTLEAPVKLSVPAGSQSGQTLRLRKKGMPRREGDRGDLLVELKIMVPHVLTSTEKDLMRKLSDASQFNPRSS